MLSPFINRATTLLLKGLDGGVVVDTACLDKSISRLTQQFTPMPRLRPEAQCELSRRQPNAAEAKKVPPLRRQRKRSRRVTRRDEVPSKSPVEDTPMKAAFEVRLGPIRTGGSNRAEHECKLNGQVHKSGSPCVACLRIMCGGG